MPRETKKNFQIRLKKVVKLLNKNYPNPECALDHSTPEELLIATILSAQCTDERVNIVTKNLFKEFPTVASYAEAKVGDLEKAVHSTGFYKNKAKNIKACCEMLMDKHKGKAPKDLDLLVELPGVGRKTANVVMGNAYGIASGVVVDTHVTRLSNRLGLAKGTNAVVLERELNELIEKKYWISFSHWLILHGRSLCSARKPMCEICYLNKYCPKKGLVGKAKVI
jgi:endonuclease-3